MKVEVTTLAPVNSGGQDIKIVVDTDTEAWSDGWCSGSDFNLLDEEIISIIQSVMTHGDVITRDSMIARPLPPSRSASRDEMLYKDKPLHEREHPGWEFHPDFKKDVMPHLEDYSWHNDSMPCFCDDATGVMVWVDHLNPDDREYYHKQDVEAHEDVMYYVEQATGKAGEWEHDNNPLLRTDDLTKVKELFNQHRSGAGLTSLFKGEQS
jgi:hypothetical protein